jgi:hypothetical protein
LKSQSFDLCLDEHTASLFGEGSGRNRGSTPLVIDPGEDRWGTESADVLDALTFPLVTIGASCPGPQMLDAPQSLSWWGGARSVEQTVSATT